MGLGEMYNYLFVELSVPYTREWLFISSPFPVLLITLGYIYFVLYAGVNYMKTRPPYKLKTFILIYDIIQILANAWIVKEHLSAGWITEMSFICKPLNKLAFNTFKMHNTVWWVFLLKIFDYIETCVFVLRKKQNQVTLLHIYHHVTNLIFCWYYLKYILDERGTFISLINCFIHVIMYMYYFIAAWSPELQQMISPIKPFITKLQMVQFIVIILILLQSMNPKCEGMPRGIIPIFIANLIIFLYLFYDFYQKAYIKLPKQKDN